jgi:hypothetical protein
MRCARFYEAVDNTEDGRAYTARFQVKPAMDEELKQLLDRMMDSAINPFRNR